MKTKISFVIGFFLLSSLVFGQTKYEKEYRLKLSSVPEEAQDFLKALGFNSKIKWYKEEGLASTSIEAKTEFNDKKYSIEFDSNGQIEDIEVEVEWKELPTATQTKICDYLTENHQKYKIEKIQIQYTGDSDNLIKKVTNSAEEGITTHYEIIVKGKTNDNFQLLEYLFSDEGNMVKKSVIVFKNTDNLEY